MVRKSPPFQSRLTSFHGRDKTVLFLEVAGNNILYNLIRVEALLGGSLLEPGLQFRIEMNFHAHNIRERYGSGNAFG